jgi:hypothetical protein
MSSDKLLDAVARAAEKDEIEEDPRWRALVEGRLSEADRKALDELAAMDARHDEARQLLTPLGDEARERFTDRILGEIARAPEPVAPPPAGAEVIALEPKRKWVPVVAALALAAGLALFVTLRRDSSTELALGDPVPSYEMALVGGERSDRAAPAQADPQAPIVLGPGSSLEILLRPATPYRKPIAVRGFLVQNGRAQSWEIKPDISADGAVRIAGERETLFANVAPGPWEVVIAVGPPGAVPGIEAVARGASEKQDARTQMVRKSIILVAPQEVGPQEVAPQRSPGSTPPLACASCRQPQSPKPPELSPPGPATAARQPVPKPPVPASLDSSSPLKKR